MPRDWTELVDGFRRDCDDSRVPASLVQALHEDNSIFDDLWKYLTTPNDMAEVEPGGMNCEMALQMLLKLSVLKDNLCRALFMNKEDFFSAIQVSTRELYGDDPENEWVALANTAERGATQYGYTFIGTDEEHESFVSRGMEKFELYFEEVWKGNTSFSVDHLNCLQLLYAVMSRARRQCSGGNLVFQCITEVLDVIRKVLERHGSDPATREALEGEQQMWWDFLCAGIPDTEGKPSAGLSVPRDLSTSPDALPPCDCAVPMEMDTPEDVRGQSGQPDSPPHKRPASTELAGPPWRRPRAPSPELQSGSCRTLNEGPYVEAGTMRILSSNPAPASMKTYEEQTPLAEPQRLPYQFHTVQSSMLKAVAEGNAKQAGDDLRYLAEIATQDNWLLNEVLTWYVKCLLTWRRCTGQEVHSCDQLAQELGVTPDLLEKTNSVDLLNKDILKMQAYNGMASRCTMEQGCNIGAVTNDIVRCLLPRPVRPTGDVGQSDLHESLSFPAMTAFVSHLRRIERKSADAEFAEFWHAISEMNLWVESRGPLQELLCVTMDYTGKEREVMAECYSIILDCFEKHSSITHSPLVKVFNINDIDERVKAHLDQSFLAPSGPWVLLLGLRLRRILGEKVRLGIDTSRFVADATALLATVPGSTAIGEDEEVDFLFASTLWDLGGGPLMWTAKQVLVHKLPIQQQTGNGLLSGQGKLSVVQALDEYFQELHRRRNMTISIHQRLWREEEEPALLKALLLRWVAVENASGQFSPALLAGIVHLLKESYLAKSDLTELAGPSKCDRKKVKLIVEHISTYLKKSRQADLSNDDIAEWAFDILENRHFSIKSLSMLLAVYAIHCKCNGLLYGRVRLVFGLARSVLAAASHVHDDACMKSEAIGAILESIQALVLDSGPALNMLWKCGDMTRDFYVNLGRCERVARLANDTRVALSFRNVMWQLLEFVPDPTDLEGAGK